MTARSTTEVLFSSHSTVAEGPLWLDETGQLSFVDVPAGLVHVGSLDGTISRTFDVGEHVGAAMPARAGGFLLARRDGFVHLAEDETQTPIDLPLARTAEMRFNDGKCDSAGRAWAGTMPYGDLVGEAELFRLSDNGRAEPVVRSITVSNGLGWSPDGHTMYYIDSRGRKLYEFNFELETATVSGQSVLVDFSGSEGAPDGLSVDGEGCLWIAFWGGWEVRRFSPRGRELERLRLPVAKVTSCCFAGDTLVITTASVGLDEAERRQQPLAGAVFAHPTSVGAPGATPWRGVNDVS